MKSLSFKNAVYYLAKLCFVMIFLYYSTSALFKYQERKTNFHTSQLAEDRLLYPSISVCKKYSFEVPLNVASNYNPETILETVKNYSWSLEETFYFFTQPGAGNLTFPCTTVEGGRDPGKPCVFPITYYGQVCDQCCLMDTELPACGTQQYAEGEELYDHFGYCSSDCKGEMPGPTSQYNLATSNNLWTSHFYDLRSFENGYCHTYDPPIKSLPGFRQRLYFLMGSLENAYNKDFDIFLHEKGQFWPRSDMFTLGQPEPIKVSKGDDIKIVFTIKEIENLNQDSRPCTDDAEFSFTICLQNYIENQSGCQKIICQRENFVKYFDLLIWIKQATLSSVINKTGCQQKCKRTQYSIEIQKSPITWISEWSSEVYVQPQSSTVEKRSEYFSFDKNDLISSLGGYLGLFLGWSLLTFFEAIPFILWLLRRGRKQKEITHPK